MEHRRPISPFWCRPGTELAVSNNDAKARNSPTGPYPLGLILLDPLIIPPPVDRFDQRSTPPVRKQISTTIPRHPSKMVSTVAPATMMGLDGDAHRLAQSERKDDGQDKEDPHPARHQEELRIFGVGHTDRANGSVFGERLFHRIEELITDRGRSQG